MLLPAGQLTFITGHVASGKTTILDAILGEIDYRNGTLRFDPPRRPRIAYCSQDPVIFDGSIRENILLGSKHDGERYMRAIEAAALQTDLASLVKGDSHAAEQLSGGQRHRVALARAIYAEAEVILLDDVLSAVDHQTEEVIFNNLFDRATGVLVGKTVVVTSNDDNRFPYADYLVQLDAGRVVYRGPPSQMRTVSRSAQLRSAVHADTAEEEKMLSRNAADEAIDAEVQTSMSGAYTTIWRHIKLAKATWSATWLLVEPQFNFVCVRLSGVLAFD